MSNLSLSFSFYFWRKNYALSVTLTNSLSQTVDVMPDGAILWYLNRHVPMTAVAWAYSPTGVTGKIPSVSEAGGNIALSVTRTSADGGNNVSGAYLTDQKIDVTPYSKLKGTGYGSATANYGDSGGNAARVYLSTSNSLGGELAHYTLPIAENSFELDLSNIDQDAYIGFIIFVTSGQNTANAFAQRLWLE